MRGRMRILAGACALAALAASCAGVTIKPHEGAAPPKSGYVFYAPQPYLVVTQAEHGGCAWDIAYLPDRSTAYVFDVERGLLGNVTATPKFTNGWMLSELSVALDAQFDELLTAAMATPDGKDAPPAPCGEIGLYRIILPAAANTDIRLGPRIAIR